MDNRKPYNSTGFALIYNETDYETITKLLPKTSASDPGVPVCSLYFTSVPTAGFALKIAIEVSLQTISTFLFIAMAPLLASNVTVKTLPRLLTSNTGFPEIDIPPTVE